jgi:hypothetical protein
MRAVILTACLLCSACSMTPAQKRWTTIGVSVVATGLVLAHQEGNGKPMVTDQTSGKGGFHPCPSGNSAYCK